MKELNHLIGSAPDLEELLEATRRYFYAEYRFKQLDHNIWLVILPDGQVSYDLIVKKKNRRYRLEAVNAG